jgi:hypothetical protein
MTGEKAAVSDKCYNLPVTITGIPSKFISRPEYWSNMPYLALLQVRTG